MDVNRKPKLAAIGAIATGAITAIAIGACSAFGGGQPQNNDLLNVPSIYPDSASLYMNVDGYPNVVLLCIRGGAIATTQRPNSNAAAFPFPEADAYCKAQEGSNFSRTGHQ